jgi:hypothetical protein
MFCQNQQIICITIGNLHINCDKDMYHMFIRLACLHWSGRYKMIITHWLFLCSHNMIFFLPWIKSFRCSPCKSLKMNVNVRIFNILWTNILEMIVYALLYIKTLKQFVWIGCHHRKLKMLISAKGGYKSYQYGDSHRQIILLLKSTISF